MENKDKKALFGFGEYTEKIYESESKNEKEVSDFDIKTKIVVDCPECKGEFKTTISFMLQNPNCVCSRCVRQKIKAMKDVKNLKDAEAKLKEYKVKYKLA